MKALIVEDEKLTAERLSDLLLKYDNSIEVLAMIDSVRQTVKWLKNNPAPDLIFLDIHLADGLCFDIFKKTTLSSPVIFTTAYDEYAIKAFKVNSIDYLLKPIGIRELTNAIDKYKQLHTQEKQGIDMDLLSNALNMMQRNYKKRFMVKTGSQLISVSTGEIAFFYAEDKLVFLKTKHNQRHAVDYTLEQLNELLNPEAFFRLNRKIIAGISAINKVHSWFNNRLKVELTPAHDDEALVSRERVSDFKKWLDK